MCEKQFLTPGDEGLSSGRVKVKRIELEATDWKRKVTGDARLLIRDARIVGIFKKERQKGKGHESRKHRVYVCDGERCF